MNIEKSLKVFNNYIKGKDTMKESLVEAIETLLTVYEKEKEIIKNAICFLKYYNKDFDEMSDNEIKQILYGFGKCADIKKEE